MGTELVIDEDNFDLYFFDARQHTPARGQVIACYTAIAEFIRGPEKKHMIDLLRNTTKAEPGTQVMRKLLHACEEDSFKVPLEMAQDMVNGMSIDEVLDKSYKYKVEIFYYTEKEHVPTDDPHWSIISLVNLDKHLGKIEDIAGNELEITTKVFNENRSNGCLKN